MRHAPPSEPWCLIGKVSWGVVQCIKVPESSAHRYRRYGWAVIVRDSDVPETSVDVPLVSGHARRVWLNEEDVRREIDEDDGG